MNDHINSFSSLFQDYCLGKGMFVSEMEQGSDLVKSRKKPQSGDILIFKKSLFTHVLVPRKHEWAQKSIFNERKRVDSL